MEKVATSKNVMKLFLLRSSILTEEDIGMRRSRGRDRVDAKVDLEVDSCIESDGDTEAPSNAEQNVAHTLGKIGDEIQKKYESGEINNVQIDQVIASFIKQQSYQTFSSGMNRLTDLCRNAYSTDPDTKLAFSLFMIQKVAEAVKNVGSSMKNTKLYLAYGEIYIGNLFGKPQQGTAAIPSSKAGTEID